MRSSVLRGLVGVSLLGMGIGSSTWVELAHAGGRRAKTTSSESQRARAGAPAEKAVAETEKKAEPVSVEASSTREGVKSYTFGAQEIEGRLRSPQILYFLRRVRAEFDPRPLGHRSFLMELQDTRRHSAIY